MSRLSQIKCDQCATIASTRAAAESGWQKITAMSVFEGPLFGRHSSAGDHADLCSWRCLMNYASDKLAATKTAEITVNQP